MSSASSTAFLMDSTVLSVLATPPFRSPLEGWVPMPIISTPSLVLSPTIAQILVVPISSPTIMLSLLAISLTASLHYVCGKPNNDLAMVIEVKGFYAAAPPVAGVEYLLKGHKLLLEPPGAHVKPHALFERKEAQPVVRVYAYLGYLCYVKSVPVCQHRYQFKEPCLQVPLLSAQVLGREAGNNGQVEGVLLCRIPLENDPLRIHQGERLALSQHDRSPLLYDYLHRVREVPVHLGGLYPGVRFQVRYYSVL